MTSPISSVGQLVAVIQAQLSATAPDARRAEQRARPGKQQSAYAPDKLGQLIEQRVRQIGRDDPQRGRKAFRVFLEAVLLSHFGEELIGDPKFHQLVEDIQSVMEADEKCKALVDSAVQQLLSE